MLDINDLRSIITLVSFLIFIGICVWSFSPKNKDRFNEASRIPLDDDKNS